MPWTSLEQGDYRVTRYALENVARDGRRNDRTVPNGENARAGLLRNVPPGIEHQRAVVAVGFRLEEGEPCVLVVRRALYSRRGHVVLDLSPRGHGEAKRPAVPATGVDDRPGRHGYDSQGDGAPRLYRALSGHEHAGPQVYALPYIVGLQQLDDQPDDVVHTVLDGVHSHEPGGLEETGYVLARTEHVQLIVVVVPVGTHALESRRAVPDRGSAYMEHGLVVRYDLAVQDQVFQLFRQCLRPCCRRRWSAARCRRRIAQPGEVRCLRFWSRRPRSSRRGTDPLRARS